MSESNTMDTTDVNPVNEDDRKLFVGGLPQEAKDTDISEHFGQHGEIDGITLKTDPTTGRSRGFAFVVFKTTEALDSAVAADEHVIMNKKVAVKKAQAKQGKIYVGKLKPELTDDDIKNHFAQFGTIAAIEQPFDKLKNERKNFCFVTYDREDTAKKLIKEGTVYINGHELEINKVTPKPMDPRMAMGGFQGGPGMRGGRGGGQGGQMHGGNWGYGPPGPQWGGYGGEGYGAPWGGYGGPQDYYGGGGYGGPGGFGAYGGYGGYGAGGKTPRGAARGGFVQRGASGGRGGDGARGGAQRQKPY